MYAIVRAIKSFASTKNTKGRNLLGVHLVIVGVMASRQYFSELKKSVLTELVNQHKFSSSSSNFVQTSSGV